MKSAEFQGWMKAQNDYTRAVIDSIPGRKKLLASISEHDNARTRVIDLQKYGDRYFYRKVEPDQENYKLYMRDAKTGQERMLVDPDHFKPPHETAHYALDYIYPSLDGKYVAYGVSPGGSENSGLFAMDAYVHVKDGTRYSAVMLTTGVNDPRVDPWEAAKMTARLQAATSSGKPILLRVDYDAGHGFGSGKTQRNQLVADELSFALWQFGDPEFQTTIGTQSANSARGR